MSQRSYRVGGDEGDCERDGQRPSEEGIGETRLHRTGNEEEDAVVDELHHSDRERVARERELRCSGTHEGEWLGVAPTGRRFENVDEVYVFRLEGDRIVAAFGVEDNLARIRQLGLSISAPPHPSGEAS